MGDHVGCRNSPPLYRDRALSKVHRFDQITCKAVFAESREATHPILNYGHGFRPLEDIYADYLQMITENKIEAQVDGQWPTGDIGTDTLCDSTFDTIGPWRR